MSLEDLREHGVLLPEQEWGEHSLRTTVPQVPLAGFLAAGAASVVFAWLGDGGPLTWVAIAAFLAALFGMTWICDRAVRSQRLRVRTERSSELTAGGGRGAAEGEVPP